MRSHEVLKARDLCLEFFDRTAIWQTPRQHCCRCASQTSKRYKHPILRLLGFARSHDKTSYHILKLGSAVLAHRCRVMHIRQYTRPSLVELMARCRLAAQPSSEPMSVCCQLDPCKQVQWNLNQITPDSMDHSKGFENAGCLVLASLVWSTISPWQNDNNIPSVCVICTAFHLSH